MTERYLLDTCALIWIAEAASLGIDASLVLAQSRMGACSLCVSAMSAWEIGMLVSKRRLPMAKMPMDWFDGIVGALAAEMIDASPDILVASSFLPAPIHNDPTDRILIATAREHDLTIITRDRAILDYGAAGHVKVLAC